MRVATSYREVLGIPDFEPELSRTTFRPEMACYRYLAFA
jgi:hypothetical protein